MPKHVILKLIPVFLLLLPMQGISQFYNGMQMQFGKNRVQHQEFIWSFYRFDNYDVYFYTDGKEVAQYTSRNITRHLKELEALFDYQLEERLQVIVYNSYDDFKQSNIGLSTSNSYNVGGETRLVGSKLFVYFEGDHAMLDRQIRSGIAEVLLNEMMYGGNWHEVIRNSTLLNLPEWFTQGLISYASTGWQEVDAYVRDGVLSGRYLKMNHLSGDEARYAGHALWHYVAQTYGPAVISNILYMTRISRNIESGFLFVIGASLSRLSDDWIAYYYNLFDGTESSGKLPMDKMIQVKTKKNRVYYEPKISPDGRYISYVGNELGQKKVYLYDTVKKKKKRIKTWGHKLDRINDFTYPLMAWHPMGELLTIITKEKGEMIMYYYNVTSGKTERRPIFLLEQINDFGYSDDGKMLVLSAVAKGQSDIFIYNITANSQEQITRDGFDDLQPRFIDNSRKIVFTSNRIDDTLRIENRIEEREYSYNKDIFIYDVESKSAVLKRITSTPLIDENYPMPYERRKILFTSDRSGVVNRYLAEPDSAIAFIDTTTHYRYFTRFRQVTDYPRSILQHEVNKNTHEYVDLMYLKGRYRFFKGRVSDEKASGEFLKDYGSPLKIFVPRFRSKEKSQTENSKKISVFDQQPDSGKIDINNYTFSEIPDSLLSPPDTLAGAPAADTLTAVADSLPEFRYPNQRNYNVIYFPEKVTTRLDLGYLNQAYQPFMGAYNNPGLGGLFEPSASDLFENHRISGVIRPALNLSNSQYLISYEDLEERLDKQYIFHRQTMGGLAGFVPFRVITNEGKYSVKWPFSEVASIRGTISGRYDKLVILSTGEATLQEPNQHDFWAIAKVEYVFDNTLNLGLNLLRGTRLKVWAEQFKLIDEKQTDMTVVGTDIRNYFKIHRTLIWANRFAASTSFGHNKLMYYMGGVDNWISPKFDQTTNIDFSQNYAYQALATNMRGFYQNARNGKSFAMLNSEIRWPIFKYFINRPIRSDFINNFQVVGFGDIGTAWNGLTPYSEENTFNLQTVVTNNIIITYQTEKEPIIGGYGFGLRSRLWGYFVRADWAWGVEDYEVKPRVFYLSLSLDF